MQDAQPVPLLPPAGTPQGRQPSDDGKSSRNLHDASNEQSGTEGSSPPALANQPEAVVPAALGRVGSNALSDVGTAQGSEEVENGGQAEVPSAASANPAPHFPPALGEDLDAWLKDLKLENFRSKVRSWCEENGAATLEEVVECSEELSAELGLPLTTKNQLLRRGQASMTRVCALSRKRRGSRPAPPSYMALGQGQMQSADDELSLQTGGCLHSQASTSSSNSRAGGSFTRVRGGGSSVASGASPGGETSATWSPRQKMNIENLDWPNVWLSTKERQGKKKKKERLQRRQFGCGGTGNADDIKDPQAAAKEKLELQLKEEQVRQRNAALGKLENALKSDQAEELGSAIADMEQAGLGTHELVSKAKKRFELLVHNKQQRCMEAVLRLQGGLEAARDDMFGIDMRESLKSAPEALQAEGGQKAVEDAKAALREWEEVCISLHMAMLCGRTEAINLALKEAEDARLSTKHSLVVAVKTLPRES